MAPAGPYRVRRALTLKTRAGRPPLSGRLLTRAALPGYPGYDPRLTGLTISAKTSTSAKAMNTANTLKLNGISLR